MKTVTLFTLLVSAASGASDSPVIYRYVEPEGGIVYTNRIPVQIEDRASKISARKTSEDIDDGSASPDRLSVRCVFNTGVSASFESDRITTSRRPQGDLKPIVFEGIDFSKSRARVIGSSQTSNVLVSKGEDSVNLLEVTESGNFMLTTIFNVSQLMRGMKVPVVHARHPIALGTPMPSQYYGFCFKL